VVDEIGLSYWLLKSTIEWGANLNIVGDDPNVVGVDLVLEGEVAEGVGDRLKVVLHGELLPGAVDDRFDLRNLVFLSMENFAHFFSL